MANEKLESIFSNNGKDNILRRMADKLKISDISDVSEKTDGKYSVVKIILTVILTLLFIVTIGYFLIFNTIQDFTLSATSNFYWIHGWTAGVISFLIAVAFTKYIYATISRFIFWKPKAKDFAIVALCISLSLASAFSNRHKFFAKDAPKLEACPALIPGESQTLKTLGQGKDEGIICFPLTEKEAALALAIDKSKKPVEIKVKNLNELEALEAFSNGAAAIYIGYAEKGSKPRIYDGPGFNPRKLGILHAITEEEFITYKADYKAEFAKRKEEKRLKLESEEKEKEAQQKKTEAEEKIKAEKEKKENERTDAENKRKDEADVARGIFRQKFVDENTKKILLSSLNIKTYIVPDNYEVIQKTNGVTQKGNTIEVRTCFICKDDYIIIRPDNHYPIPYPPDSYFSKGQNNKLEEKLIPEKQPTGKPVHGINIEMLDRDPPKETFVFNGGGKLEGNKVSNIGPIRITSTACLKVFISVDDLPPYQVCDGRSWTVQSGQIWKIVNNENYSIYSKNIKVSSFN